MCVLSTFGDLRIAFVRALQEEDRGVGDLVELSTALLAVWLVLV